MGVPAHNTGEQGPCASFEPPKDSQGATEPGPGQRSVSSGNQAVLPSAFFASFPLRACWSQTQPPWGPCVCGVGAREGGRRKLGCRRQDEIQDSQGVSWVPGPAPIFSHHHCSLGRVGFPRVPFIDKETELLS